MTRKHRSKGTGSLFRKQPKGPWIASWYDHDGRRRERSTRTTDRAAAERILAKHVADAALRRDLVIDPKADRYATEGRKPLKAHIADYITHCRNAGQDSHHIGQKDAQLKALANGSRASRLGDLTADALEVHLAALSDRGLSARSVNFARQIAVAFCQWYVRTGRAESNPLRVVPKRDESRDRRRVRRPLTDDELARLLAVARERGREAWYLSAALAGLRRGDLRRLTWADVDFAEASITVRHGKAKRVDVVPMHLQLADALRRRFQERPGTPTARVFPETVTDRTRQQDFLRAGLAREEVVMDADGQPVMVGKDTKRSPLRPKTRIVTKDDEGREIDLHALRTTLGTQLARQGVAPQIAQRIMRHGDYRTTLKHYTVLGLTDTTAAMDKLPGVGRPGAKANEATGTHNASPDDHQRYCQQLGRENQQSGASGRNEHRKTGTDASDASPRENGPYGPSEGKRVKGVEPSTFSLGS